MADAVNCTVCGGTDFYNEAGFYFCNECQTQTQEIREQVFEIQEDTVRLKKRTIHKDKSKNTNANKITSWEGYNYILAGLAKELVELGANENFKDTAYNIWVLYLAKLEILSVNPNHPPKLGAVYKKKDADIVYERRREKRKRKKVNSMSGVSSSDLTELDSKTLGREKAKQKRALVKAEYESFTGNTNSSDKSLINQSLTSLSSGDESVSKLGKIKFSRAAKKELLKHMSRQHMNKHINDGTCLLKCHKKIKTIVSQTYVRGAHTLTRTKLYAILYLALLITNDDIQLSDMIRYCREGRLSFLQYKHFFPDHFSDKDIDEKIYQGGTKAMFEYDRIRHSACDIYKLLDLKQYNFTPNLHKLCRRYCTELNLPDQVYNITADLIEQTKPMSTLNICSKTRYIRNYEGRAMSFIMYTLKALFGLDDTTEYKFTRFAKELNEYRANNEKNELLDDDMFVWDLWTCYIDYRNVILKNVHFPTNYLFSNEKSVDHELFREFLKHKKSLNLICESQHLTMEITRKLLCDLEILQSSSRTTFIHFNHSLTPFRSYIEKLKEMESFTVKGYSLKKNYLEDFSKRKVDFLVRSLPYLKLLYKNPQIQYKGANLNQKFVKMTPTNYSNDKIIKLEKKWHKAFAKIKEEILILDLLEDKIVKETINDTTFIKEVKIPCNPKIASMKQKVGRSPNGKFCSLNSPNKKDFSEFPPKKRSKWYVSSWTENPTLKEHKFSAVYKAITEFKLEDEKNKSGKEIKLEEIETSKKQEIKKETTLEEQKTPEEEKKLEKQKTLKKRNQIQDEKQKLDKEEYIHYVPRMEYWINVTDTTYLLNYKFDEFEKTLPKSFQWLLTECARTLEQPKKTLFSEFTDVELFINYVYENNQPVLNKEYDNSVPLSNLIKKAKKNW